MFWGGETGVYSLEMYPKMRRGMDTWLSGSSTGYTVVRI